jgi:hypothetical protein
MDGTSFPTIQRMLASSPHHPQSTIPYSSDGRCVIELHSLAVIRASAAVTDHITTYGTEGPSWFLPPLPEMRVTYSDSGNDAGLKEAAMVVPPESDDLQWACFQCSRIFTKTVKFAVNLANPAVNNLRAMKMAASVELSRFQRASAGKATGQERSWST